MNWLQIRRLKSSVERWNKWRARNPYVEVDLQDADLRGMNLMGANLSEANLREARLGEADLGLANLSKANLWGVNLSGADLSGADLSGADLWMADLGNADLRGCQLVRVRALDANFQASYLTGACVESWNTNSQTNFEGVICDYIYLDRDRKERRPYHRDRTFAPGEFAHIFRKPNNTFNLYFRDNINWQAAARAFQRIAMTDSKSLEILKIEKRYGRMVIKINVPENANKNKIEAEFWQGYEIAQKVLAGQQENANNVNLGCDRPMARLMNLLSKD